MTIYFFIDYWPMRKGGMETHAYEYIRHLRKNKNITYKVIGFSKTAQKVTEDSNVTVFPEKALHDPELLLAYLNNKNIEEGDIFFFNSIYWIELYSSLKATFPKNDIYLRSGGNDIIHSNILSKGDTLKERQKYTADTINAYVSKLIINSNYTRERFTRAGIVSDKFMLIRGGVDLERFKPLSPMQIMGQRKSLGLDMQDDTLILLSVHRLVPFKNLITLLKARSILAPDSNYFHIIIGGGIEEERLKKEVKELQLEDSTLFLGSLDISEVQKYYQIADVYAQVPIEYNTKVQNGSYIHTETMGRSFCEAIATGLPILASSVGGIPEIVRHGENGLLVDPHNAIDINTALEEFALSKELRQRLSENNQKLREKISWDNIFKQYDEEMKIL